MSSLYVIPMDNLIIEAEKILYSVENALSVEFILNKTLVPTFNSYDSVDVAYGQVAIFTRAQYGMDEEAYSKLLTIFQKIIARFYLAAIDYNIEPAIRIVNVELDSIYVESKRDG